MRLSSGREQTVRKLLGKIWTLFPSNHAKANAIYDIRPKVTMSSAKCKRLPSELAYPTLNRSVDNLPTHIQSR